VGSQSSAVISAGPKWRGHLALALVQAERAALAWWPKKLAFQQGFRTDAWKPTRRSKQTLAIGDRDEEQA
jgi:hypothetical protein